MFRKWSAVLAVLVLLAAMGGLFTGCSPATTTIGGTDGENFDFGGQAITIAHWGEDIIPTLGTSDHGDALYYALEYAKEKYHATVEYTILPETTYFETFVANSLAGTKFADIMMSHCWQYVSWIQQGLLQPMTKYMENEDEHWLTSKVVFNGEIWNIDAAPAVTWPEYFLLYNTDILAELNLEDPQELVAKGQWDWDTFRSYCKAAVADTNNDGETDRYGFSTFWMDIILKMSSDFDNVTYSNGKYMFSYSVPEVRTKGLNMLQFMQDMKITDGSVYGLKVGGQDIKDDMTSLFQSGNLLFCMADNNVSRGFKRADMKNYRPVTLPKGEGISSLKNYYQSFQFYSIPTYASYDTEALVAFCKDMQNTWDESHGKAFDVSTTEDAIDNKWSDCFLSYEDTMFMYEQGLTMSWTSFTDVPLQYNGWTGTYDFYMPLLTGSLTPAAAVESIESLVQQKIDEIYNGVAPEDTGEGAE